MQIIHLIVSKNILVILIEFSSVCVFLDSKDLYDPTINELESHKFSVSTLYKCSTVDKFTFISSDISGEVFFHQIDEVRMF